MRLSIQAVADLLKILGVSLFLIKKREHPSLLDCLPLLIHSRVAENGQLGLEVGQHDLRGCRGHHDDISAQGGQVAVEPIGRLSDLDVLAGRRGIGRTWNFLTSSSSSLGRNRRGDFRISIHGGCMDISHERGRGRHRRRRSLGRRQVLHGGRIDSGENL